MGQRYKIGRALGVDVFLHWTCILEPFYVVYLSWKHGLTWPIVGILIVILFALNACVLFHEYGHALAARYFGVETQDIILTPIGGAARLVRMPQEPLQEFAIAAAGPCVNLVIALGFAIYIAATGASLSLFTESGFNGFAQAMVWMNGFLFLFNLIPAYPMDGGRIFRSILAVSFSYETATLIAAVMGQVVAVGVIVYGFYSGDMLLVFIAALIFFAARAEVVAE